MRASRQDLPEERTEIGEGWASCAETHWAGMTVSFESMPGGVYALGRDGQPDPCESPHWGYMVSGQLRLIYEGHEEVVSPGDAFYAPPGHVHVFDRDCELVEFTPGASGYCDVHPAPGLS